MGLSGSYGSTVSRPHRREFAAEGYTVGAEWDFRPWPPDGRSRAGIVGYGSGRIEGQWAFTMTEQNWTPLFRTSTSTVTKILRSQAFLRSRERSATIVGSSDELRALAGLVETLDMASAPLAAVADRVAAAVRFLRDRANRLDDAAALTHNSAGMGGPKNSDAPSAGVATRERLLIASLHYLVTPDDLVPDFRPGGYIDDVFLLSWVFGVANNELTRYLADDPEGGETASLKTMA